MTRLSIGAAVLLTACGPDATALVGGLDSDVDQAMAEGELTASNQAARWLPLAPGNTWTFESSSGERVVKLTNVGQGMAVLEGLFATPRWVGVADSAPNTLYMWNDSTWTWNAFLRFGYAVSSWNLGTGTCTGLKLRRASTGVATTVPAGTFTDTRVIGVQQVIDPRALCAPPAFTELSFAADIGLIGFKTGHGERFQLTRAQVSGRSVPGVPGKLTLDKASYVNKPNTIVCITWPCPSNQETATATVGFTVTNTTASTQTWRFTSGCQYDVELTDSTGKIVRRLSDGRACTMALTQLTLRPGEARTWSVGLTLEDSTGLQLNGAYTARAWLIGSGGPAVAASAPLTVRVQ